MLENNNEIIEAIQILSTHLDEQIDRVRKDIDGVRKDIDETKTELTGQIGKLRLDLIDHVERTVNNAKGDIIQTLKTDRERHKLFHEKLLNIFEHNQLAKPEEITVLRELVV